MWFSAATGNMVGAIIGSLIGVIAGGWGALAGISAAKGKRRGIVMNIGKGIIVIGIASLLFGIVALLSTQARHVWYPFILIGVIITASIFPLYFSVKKVYTDAELKKMSVDDLQ